MEKLVMSVEEAGKLLGVSRPTAYRLAQSEGFPAIRVGRRVVVSREGLRQWVLKQAGAEIASSANSATTVREVSA